MGQGSLEEVESTPPPPLRLREVTPLKKDWETTLQRFAKIRHDLSSAVSLRQGKTLVSITQVTECKYFENALRMRCSTN